MFPDLFDREIVLPYYFSNMASLQQAKNDEIQ